MSQPPEGPSRWLRSRTLGGFTLLEVMVAVAILSLSLVAIFSSEVGAVRVGARARAMTTATLLARCKMAEVEEQVAREGLPALSDSGEDRCCEGGEVDGYSCEWNIERVVLPEAIGDSEGDGALGDLVPGLGGSGESAPSPAEASAAGSSVQDAIAGGGSMDMLGSVALEIAFPALKPFIEEQVRRATVTVTWREGTGSQSFSVVQFLVADQGTDTGAENPDDEDLEDVLQGRNPTPRGPQLPGMTNGGSSR